MEIILEAERTALIDSFRLAADDYEAGGLYGAAKSARDTAAMLTSDAAQAQALRDRIGELERELAAYMNKNSDLHAGIDRRQSEAAALADERDGWKIRAEKAEAALPIAVKALREGAAWFFEYADGHASKQTPDGDAKAQRNIQRALRETEAQLSG